MILGQGKEHLGCQGLELGGIRIAVALDVDKLGDLAQQKLHIHGLFKTCCVLGLVGQTAFQSGQYDDQRLKVATLWLMAILKGLQ